MRAVIVAGLLAVRLRRPGQLRAEIGALPLTAGAGLEGGQLEQRGSAGVEKGYRHAAGDHIDVEPSGGHGFGQAGRPLQVADAEQVLHIEQNAPRHPPGSKAMSRRSTWMFSAPSIRNR